MQLVAELQFFGGKRVASTYQNKRRASPVDLIRQSGHIRTESQVEMPS